MTRVKVLKDSKKRIKSIVIEDHAQYAKAGEDIVCAAISSLVYTFINSLERVLRLNKSTYNITINKKQALIKIDFNRDLIKSNRELDLLIEFLMVGLTQIRREFKNHIKILVKEDKDV